MLLCTIAICTSAGVIITPQVTTLGRLPRVVLLVICGHADAAVDSVGRGEDSDDEFISFIG